MTLTLIMSLKQQKMLPNIVSNLPCPKILCTLIILYTNYTKYDCRRRNFGVEKIHRIFHIWPKQWFVLNDDDKPNASSNFKRYLTVVVRMIENDLSLFYYHFKQSVQVIY